MLDNQHVPRATLSGSGVIDLAKALVTGVNASIPYASLADVIALGSRYGADPQGIAIARQRMTEAANAGNAMARDLLAELDREAA